MARKMTLPLAIIGGLAHIPTHRLPNRASMLDYLMDGDINGAFESAKVSMTGIDVDGRFYPDYLVRTYAPLIMGMLIHKFVGGSPLNLNRTLASAGVPIIRI